MNQNLPPEKHLIILWPNCNSVRTELENAISKNLKVLLMAFGEWNESNAEVNYSRFYQQNLFGNNDIISHKGTGLFHIYVVLDPLPTYNFQKTTRGYEFINTNIFKLKSELRELTLGGHQIHATNSQDEFRCDVAMLWGIDVLEVPDFEQHVPKKITGTFGIEGFTDINEVFILLNCCTDYLVLRNYEEILELENSEHPDIDLLVSDVEQARLVLNAEPVFPENYRVHFKNVVNRRDVFWDLRFPADGYMDLDWAVELKKARTELVMDQMNTTIFGLVGLDYYFSLAYHALIHKKEVSHDYFSKLSNLRRSDLHSTITTTETLLNDVAQYLAERNFKVSRPIDSSVFFNESNCAKIMATKSVIQFESFLKNVKTYASNLVEHEITLNYTSHFNCIRCNIWHFYVQLILHDSKYDYYGLRLSNGQFFLITLQDNPAVKDLFLLTKLRWNRQCRNCLDASVQLDVVFTPKSNVLHHVNKTSSPIIFLWSKEYSGKSLWRNCILGLVRTTGDIEVVSETNQSQQDSRNFLYRSKCESFLPGPSALTLCVNYLKLGMISSAANTFSVFSDLMAVTVDSYSDTRWKNIDLIISNVIFVNNAFEWVDVEVFGDTTIPNQYIKLRCTLTSLKLILQSDCTSKSKDVFLSNVSEKVASEFLSVDFRQYLEYEYELQSIFRPVDYKTFLRDESYFFYNLIEPFR